MEYRALAEELVPVAETVRKHFARAEGVTRFRAEVEVESDLGYRPTLLGETSVGLVAIEVNEGSYTDPLDRFVLDCFQRGLAVRLFVASPAGGPEAAKLGLIRRAKQRGVGVVEVDGTKVSILVPALSLSLMALRPVDKKRFPKAYRAPLQQAEDTFRNGDPAKGCGRVYDLLEKRSRAVAAEIAQLGLWRASSTANPPKFRSNTAWSTVLERIDEHADFSKLPGSGLDVGKPLWSRIRGIIPHRNESGHEPSSRKAVQRRDEQLRTRFEHAIDTLADLVESSKRVKA